MIIWKHWGGEYHNFSELRNAIRLFGLPDVSFNGETFNYKKLAKAFLSKYPILHYMGICGESEVDSKKLKTIVEYIESLRSTKKELTSTPALV